MDGRKVYINDWLDTLVDNIKFNLNCHNEFSEKNPDGDDKYYAEKAEKLLDKIDKYKKTDDEGHVYFYFFPNELENIMWVLLENNLYKGVK